MCVPEVQGHFEEPQLYPLFANIGQGPGVGRTEGRCLLGLFSFREAEAVASYKGSSKETCFQEVMSVAAETKSPPPSLSSSSLTFFLRNNIQ